MWINSFLTGRNQRVRVGHHTFKALSISMGSLQGCLPSPLLYTLYMHDCTPAHHSNIIVKFADDNTVVGFISEGDESAYRDEFEHLASWCNENNLLLDTSKTRELGIDFRREKNWHSITRHQRKLWGAGFKLPLPGCPHRGGPELKCEQLGGAEKKNTQQRLHFLRVLKKNNITQRLLLSFYRCTIESILTTAYVCGSPAAQQPRGKSSRGSITLPRRSLVPPSPSAGRPARCSLRQKSTEHWEGHFLPGTPIVQTVSFGGTIQDHQIKNKET